MLLDLEICERMDTPCVTRVPVGAVARASDDRARMAEFGNVTHMRRRPGQTRLNLRPVLATLPLGQAAWPVPPPAIGPGQAALRGRYRFARSADTRNQRTAFAAVRLGVVRLADLLPTRMLATTSRETKIGDT